VGDLAGSACCGDPVPELRGDHQQLTRNATSEIIMIFGVR
jgi:hypothetical protein